MRTGALSLGLLFCASTALAQVRGQVDAGVAGPGTWSLAPDLGLEGSRARVDLTGEFRDFRGPGAGAAGTLSGSLFRALAGPLSLELAGSARGQAGTGVADAGAWQAGPLLHLHRSDQGVWLGFQGGRDRFGGTLRWEAGAWRQVGRLSIQVQGWQTSSGVAPSVATSPSTDTLAPLDTLRRGATTSTTTDVGAWLRWSAARVELAVASGLRLGLFEPRSAQGAATNGPAAGGRTISSAWWMAEGTWWLGERLGIAGTVGRQSPDPAFNLPGRDFLRLGFRAALGRRRPPPTTPAPQLSRGFGVRRMDAEVVEFALEAPGADRVEIMGDFTDWSPVPMERDSGGVWRAHLPAAPGLHRANIRRDGGAWRAPPATRVVRDEFGSESGEFLIR